MAPLPPEDLSTRDIGVQTLAPQRLVRIHWPGRALHFTGTSGMRGIGRFDAPNGEFRTLYSAFVFRGAFVEAMLRQERPPILALSDIRARQVSVLRIVRRLRVIPMSGFRLLRMSATAAVATGSYRVSQRWSHALWQWRDGGGHLDGIVYRSRHDEDLWCLALFDRAASAIELVSTESLATRMEEISGFRSAYRFALDLDT